MKDQEPFVVLDVDCSAAFDVAQAPDTFRIKITPAVMEEMASLRLFHQQVSTLFDMRFNGKKFGDMDAPFDHFVAEASEEDSADHIDRRLDRHAMRLEDGGFKLTAFMRVVNVKLVSEKVSFDLLKEKFAELRALVTEANVMNAIDGVNGEAVAPTKPRGNEGVSL